jgi:hypothetical protein
VVGKLLVFLISRESGTPVMFNNFTVITATGDRPLCFSLLKRWMKAQTCQPACWVIIDDGKIPMKESEYNDLPDYVTLLRRNPRPDDPKHTLNINLMAALPYVEGEFIIFCEDDEYYAPEYLATMSRYLKEYEVVGVCRSRYYHLPSFRYYIHSNYDHASLAQTGMRVSFIEDFKQLLVGDPFIDMRIWKKVGNKNELMWGKAQFRTRGQEINGKRGYLFDDAIGDRYIYVGMKGMSGRDGIGSGHKGIGLFDYDMSTLKKWIIDPNHYKMYADLSKTLSAKAVVPPPAKRRQMTSITVR